MSQSKANITPNTPNATPSTAQNSHEIMQMDYFAPLLPWQQQTWQQVVGQYQSKQLPHGLLVAGMAGIGKRAFVARLIAWLLCTNHDTLSACGHCQSCLWLKAGVHPDLRYLPHDDSKTIKIDDIRGLQDFLHTKSTGVRLVVLDNADGMTLGASNALLKTLEEPSDGVFLILMSDYPSRLLDTIKSRTQSLVFTADPGLSHDYVAKHTQGDVSAWQLLQWADYAPLLAVDLPNQPWFAHRKAWLMTYVALYQRARTAVQASDYWQTQLALPQFLQLSWLLLTELWRIGLLMPSEHEDINAQAILAPVQAVGGLQADKLTALMYALQDTVSSLNQNIQPKQAYDALFVRMATLNEQ